MVFGYFWLPEAGFGSRLREGFKKKKLVEFSTKGRFKKKKISGIFH